MQLTPAGAHAAQLGLPQRMAIANQLMLLVGPPPITNYITNGICYDTVAFVRYLRGAAITPVQLVTITGQNWAPLFNAGGGLWVGGPIAAGTAVLFRRPPALGGAPFHVGLSLGGTTVRAVNGNTLGAGWNPIGDCNIGALVAHGGMPNTYICGPGTGDLCQVWLSAL